MSQVRPNTSQERSAERRRHEGGIGDWDSGLYKVVDDKASRRDITGGWDSGLYKVIKNEPKTEEPGRYNREAHAQKQAQATPPSPVQETRKSGSSQSRDDWLTQNGKTIPKKERFVRDGPITLKVVPRGQPLRDN